MYTKINNIQPHGELGIIALESCKNIGIEIDDYVKKLRKDNGEESDKESYLIKADAIRFSNGEGKVKLRESVRGKDIYILCDVGNYSCTYNMFGFTNHMSPDEHFQDIKRVVSAISGKANRVSVIMPLLYASRQHRRKGRESLDCALALQELQNLGVKTVVTFDVHDPNIQNAVPTSMSFENFYPTHTILESLIDNEDIKDILVISPDMGAMERARYYADMLGCDVGVFYKRRDLSKVVNGKNPIVEHMYMGAIPEGKDVIFVDDMIASGGSMIEVAEHLKNKGANKVYLIATFTLFTEGVDKFVEAFDKGLFNKLYTTNLSYIPENIKELEWFNDVDCSKYLALIINTFNKKDDIEPLWNGKKKIIDKIRKKMSL